MAYSRLLLKQFRSYSDHTVTLSPGVNIVVGPNGSGKTNLLEALYVLSQGTSFRVGDKELVQQNQQWLRLEGAYQDQQRVLTYDVGRLPAKQFNLDGVKKQRLSHAQKIPLVLFEPNELRLLHGSPQRRREYIDGLAGRLWPLASPIRGRFERALLQRNNIIKQASLRPQQALEDELFVWDIKLAEYAAALVQQRLQLLEHWNLRLGELYSGIAATPSQVTVRYKSDVAQQGYKADLLRQLTSRRHVDIQRGFTSVGPQRDDLTILLNGADAAVTASRGELRTLVLAIKMIELQLLAQLSDRPPLLLLDDVFSELDATRRQTLAELAKEFQTVITTTDADIALNYFPHDQTVLKMPL